MTAPKNATLLVDADVICHKFAYSNTQTFSWDGESTEEALQPERAKVKAISELVQLIDALDAKTAIVVLSDRERNFRKELDPTYKSNRKEKPKPTLWYVIRECLETQKEFEVYSQSRLEGDDSIGILHTGAYRDASIMVSIDKDMNTVPGWLFNPDKPQRGVVAISDVAASRFHMMQTLTGDPTDGYPGLPGIGPKKAEAILSDCNDQKSMWEAVVAAYVAKGSTEEAALLQARLAHILVDGDYIPHLNKVRLWKPHHTLSD